MIPRVLAIAFLGLGCAKIAGLSTHVAAGDGGAGGGSGASGSDAGPSDGPLSMLAPGPMCGGPDAAACPTGLGNCAGTGCTVSLTSDQNNCGVCGRSCRGGECQEGECLPVTIATGQALYSRRLIAVSPIGVTWGTEDGFVKTLPFGPGAQPITLAEGEGQVQAIVVDDEFAYITTDSADHCHGGWCIRRISLVPGKYPATNLDNLFSYAGDLAVDANYLYYNSQGTIYRLPLHAGGLPMPQQLAANQGRVSMGLVLDREYVYWGSNSDTEGIVKRIHLDGSDVAPQHLAAGLPEVASVAIDETNVYWTTGGSGKQVQTTSKQGNGPIVTLATDGADTVAMAVDEVNVYWGGSGGDPNMRKVAKCGGEMRTAAQGSSVFGIVPYLGNVYYNDSMSGIFRIAQ